MIILTISLFSVICPSAEKSLRGKSRRMVCAGKWTLFDVWVRLAESPFFKEFQCLCEVFYTAAAQPGVLKLIESAERERLSTGNTGSALLTCLSCAWHILPLCPRPPSQNIPLGTMVQTALQQHRTVPPCKAAVAETCPLNSPIAILGTVCTGGKGAGPLYFGSYNYSVTCRAVRKRVSSSKLAFRSLVLVFLWLLREVCSVLLQTRECGQELGLLGRALEPLPDFTVLPLQKQFFVVKHSVFCLRFPAGLIYSYFCKELGCTLSGFLPGVSLFCSQQPRVNRHVQTTRAASGLWYLLCLSESTEQTRHASHFHCSAEVLPAFTWALMYFSIQRQNWGARKKSCKCFSSAF